RRVHPCRRCMAHAQGCGIQLCRIASSTIRRSAAASGCHPDRSLDRRLFRTARQQTTRRVCDRWRACRAHAHEAPHCRYAGKIRGGGEEGRVHWRYAEISRVRGRLCYSPLRRFAATGGDTSATVQKV
ncbi:hypothetical protein LTR94_032312, partial [Friedmanniomyces endolithicus]